MNKAELIDVLTEKLNTDRRQATAAVENVVDTIVRAVHKGDSVTITGFGVFEQRRRAARVARNPRTGETVKVKPTSVPAFRPGAQFKAVVAGAQKLPSEGPAVKRGVVASAAKKTAAKKAPAKKAATKAPAKKAAHQGSGQEGRDQGSGQEGRDQGSGQEGRRPRLPPRRLPPRSGEEGRDQGSGQEGRRPRLRLRRRPPRRRSGQEGSGQEGYEPQGAAASNAITRKYPSGGSDAPEGYSRVRPARWRPARRRLVRGHQPAARQRQHPRTAFVVAGLVGASPVASHHHAIRSGITLPCVADHRLPPCAAIFSTRLPAAFGFLA